MKLKNCKPGVRVEVKPSPLHGWSGRRGVIAWLYPADSTWPVAVELDDGEHVNFGPEELRRLTPKVGDRVRVVPETDVFGGCTGTVVRYLSENVKWTLSVLCDGEGIPAAFAIEELERIR